MRRSAGVRRSDDGPAVVERRIDGHQLLRSNRDGSLRRLWLRVVGIFLLLASFPLFPLPFLLALLVDRDALALLLLPLAPLHKRRRHALVLEPHVTESPTLSPAEPV